MTKTAAAVALALALGTVLLFGHDEVAGADGLTLPFSSPSYNVTNAFFDHDQPGCTNCGAMIKWNGQHWDNGEANWPPPTCTIQVNCYNGHNGIGVSLAGGNSLTGSLAISTRPNGMYHMVALRSDGIVFMQCSVNYASWWGWSSIGGTMGGGLSIDNDSANGSCDVDARNPGVHVVGIGNNIAYVRCWDPQCPQAAYDPLGPTVGAPSAVSNSVNPFAGSSRWVDVAVRSGNDELHRYRVY